MIRIRLAQGIGPALAVLASASMCASVTARAQTCSVSIYPKNHKYVEVLVDMNGLQSNRYASNVVIGVSFQSGANESYAFTEEAHPALDHGKVYRRYFQHSQAVPATVVSGTMHFMLCTMGAKADDPRASTPAPVPTDLGAGTTVDASAGGEVVGEEPPAETIHVAKPPIQVHGPGPAGLGPDRAVKPRVLAQYKPLPQPKAATPTAPSPTPVEVPGKEQISRSTSAESTVEGTYTLTVDGTSGTLLLRQHGAGSYSPTGKAARPVRYQLAGDRLMIEIFGFTASQKVQRFQGYVGGKPVEIRGATTMPDGRKVPFRAARSSAAK